MAVPFPSDFDERKCYVVPINVTLIPYVAGMLKMMEMRGFWETEEDYIRGYNEIVALQGCMMATCMDDLLQRQDSLYRLVNTALFGQIYEEVSSEPLIIEPAIEPFVSLDILEQDSMLGRIDRLTQMLDNRLAGTETPLYDQLPGIKQQLEAIIAALEEGTDLTEVISNLEAIALLLGV
jgi:hypothetical protein